MRARTWARRCVVAASVIGALAASDVAPAHADPKPIKVDVSAFRKDLLVLKDSAGNVYIVKPGKLSEMRFFFGTEKIVHEQIIQGRSADGSSWNLNTWAPRVPQIRPGVLSYAKDGSYSKSCDGRDDHKLTQLTGDKAKAILDKVSFLSSALIRRPHLLARDDAGTYYYVDIIRNEYGSNGHRVFVGKKGAMKQLALTDVASDTAGDVFATKTGDLRLVKDAGPSESGVKVTWIKGEKRRDLVMLDVDANSRLIFRDFGIYKFLGTICDNI